jgi:homoserine O-acetyltransferase
MDLGRGRTSYEGAHARIRARLLAVGIASDLLFPPYLQQETVRLVQAAGGDATYLEMTSPWGHDAFLCDWEEIASAVGAFLA